MGKHWKNLTNNNDIFQLQRAKDIFFLPLLILLVLCFSTHLQKLTVLSTLKREHTNLENVWSFLKEPWLYSWALITADAVKFASLYSNYNTNMSEGIHAGRHEGICKKWNSHATEGVALAKYSKREIIWGLGAKEENLISSWSWNTKEISQW